MKYYIIAGEASGDLHASNLMYSLAKMDTSATFRCWGGDKMKEAGGEMVEHYRNTAFMGFLEVAKNIRAIFGFINKCKGDILYWKPDVLVLIDYPGFNLRIAEWASKQGLKVVYYITPQVWAWHKSRVHKLVKFTNKLLVILPFEEAFFKKYGYEATYVGHPLTDAIQKFEPDHDFQRSFDHQEVLAILPGSRKQEICLILPDMLKAAQDMDRTILLAAAPAIDTKLYNDIIDGVGMTDRVSLVRNKTYDILSVAKEALVASGTATLETALFGVPQVVCYKSSTISYMIAKRLVDIPFISLVNLIAGKEVVKELIQDDMTAKNIHDELLKLQINRQKILDDYTFLKDLLADSGASDKAASEIYQMVQ